MMNRICWWFANLFSRSLDRSEREAVIGDLVEFSKSGSRALRDVVDLVARRQAEIWSDWRAWLTLAFVLFPICVLLSLVSGHFVGMSSVYGWLYFHNWDWRLLQNRGFWYVLGDSLRSLFGAYVRIACLSWSVGFLLGHKVRRLKTSVLGFLFCLTLLFAALKAAPAYLAFQSREIQQVLHLARIPAQHDPMAASVLYRMILPLMTMAAFVALPATFGMRHAEAGSMHPGMVRSAVPAACLALVGTVLQVPGVIVLVLLKLGVPPGTWRGGPPPVHLGVLLLEAITYWPLAYWLAQIVTGLRERLAGFGHSQQFEIKGR